MQWDFKILYVCDIHIYFAYESGLSAIPIMQSDPLISVAAGLVLRKLSCLTLKQFASAMFSALPKAHFCNT